MLVYGGYFGARTLRKDTSEVKDFFLIIYYSKKKLNILTLYSSISFFINYLPLGANIYDLISLREAKVVISLNIKQRYEKKSRKSNKLINNLKYQCLELYLVV